MSKDLGSAPSTYDDDDDDDRLYDTAITPSYGFIANSHPCSCFVTSVGYVLILESWKILEELKKTLFNFCYFYLFVCLFLRGLETCVYQVEVRGQVAGVASCLPPYESSNQTHVVRLSSTSLYLMSRLLAQENKFNFPQNLINSVTYINIISSY